MRKNKCVGIPTGMRQTDELVFAELHVGQLNIIPASARSEIKIIESEINSSDGSGREKFPWKKKNICQTIFFNHASFARILND